MWDIDGLNIDLSDIVINIEGFRDDEATSPFTSPSDAEATEETAPLESVAPAETVATDPAVSPAFDNLDGLERIFDFQAGEDTFVFGAAATDFVIVEALDYADAFADAASLLADDQADYVAVQFGDDVLVFADVNNIDAIGAAVVLVGRSLSDLGLGGLG